MYARSGLLTAGADSGAPQQLTRVQGQPPAGSQQMPNAPQKFARQQQYAVKSQNHTPVATQQAYSYSASHNAPQVSLSQAQNQATAARTQRRSLSHGGSGPYTPSAASPSVALARDETALKIYYMTPPADLQPLCKDQPEIGYPDYFPWTGAHPEDLLTESYIQHGFEDKPFLSNETGSARQPLFSLMGQQASLNSLSGFIMSAIDKRHELNIISRPTTFKPPPRVTLTDHKREAWLRDLAMPSVPLRRLSRTIPHGLRNKILIEQCCNKGVPINRAVWFARCVGANELRGLKRKGNNTSTADAEAQWVREWTLQFAGFIEKVISECGKRPDPSQKNMQDHTRWRARMDYSIRLASQLYSEDLLDRSVFLDWTIAQLELGALEHIPIALLFIRLFWRRIVDNPIKARRLAEVLLNHVKVVWSETLSRTNHADAYQQLLSKLANCVWDLQRDSCEAFLIPESWSSMRSVLQKILHIADVDKAAADKAFETIALANMNLAYQKSLLKDSGASARSTEEDKRERLFTVLRNSGAPYDIDEISDELLLTASMPSFGCDSDECFSLIDVLFEWAVCNGQCQTARVDLSTSVLMKWVSLGKQVFDALFRLFDSFTELNGIDFGLFKLFLSQVLEKRVFAADVYIRRVISRGIFLLPELKDKVRCHGFILANMPLEEYPDSIQIQRDVLLQNIPAEILNSIGA